MLVQDLGIKVVGVNNKRKLLIEAAPYFMKTWPGWSRSTEYADGKIDLETWYERFRQYLMYKLSSVLNNDNLYKEEKPKGMKTASVQTAEEDSIKPDAPHTLVVSGPPSVVSNLVFLANNNSVVIKQHTDKPWDTLDSVQFLNWPYVSVTLNLPEIGVTRATKVEYHRYISMCGDVTANPTSPYIDSVVSTGETHEVYTYNYLYHYAKQLKELMEHCKDISQDRKTEINTILFQFMNDVSAVSIKDRTLATNCTISYNIGKFKYIRNKKMVGGNRSTAINFYEILIPRVQFSLNHFSAIQDLTSPISSFVQLNKLKNLLEKFPNSESLQKFIFDLNNDCISYKCLFCDESFEGPYARHSAITHFENDHKSEQSVLCFKCRTQFEIKYLAGNRWAHDCCL